jgi:hypothetical protein
MNYSYDALGRRTALNSPQVDYDYDGSDAIRSSMNPGVNQITSDFARLPGGEVVEAMVTGGSDPGLWCPCMTPADPRSR